MDQPADIYLDRSRKTLLELIDRLLHFSDAVIYLEGPVGSGRTTLLELASKNFHRFNEQAGELQVIDDVDQLNPTELLQQIERSNNCKFLLSGLPGSSKYFRELRSSDSPPVERLSIAPFTRPDAENFLINHCPAVSKRHRRAILNSERLYPQQLIKAAYLQELSYRGFNRRYSPLSAFIAVLLIGLAWFAITRGLPLHPDQAQVTVDEVSTNITRLPTTTTKPDAYPRSDDLLIKPEEAVIPDVTPPQPADTKNNLPKPAIRTMAETRLFTLATATLLAKPPNHVTIQLMQASNPDNIVKLRQRHQLQPTFIYLRQVGQQQLYCLLMGDYPSMEAAAAAISSLPEELINLGPWRRSFAAVQKELATAAE